MKSIAYLKIALGLGKLACCVMWAASVGSLRAESESLPYHWIGFEEDEGYGAGRLESSKGGLQLLQGEAQIVRDESEASQCLETVAGDPYASTYFFGERVSRNHKTYYEVWVRPSASPMEKSEEFMDFDGAILGFFADGSGKPATFHAYHALPEQQGYWVSTGVSAAIEPSGMTQEWVRIGICQNLATGTWDLKIGGEMVLSEIRNTETPRQDAIQLWLLGHETGSIRFDDLLISAVEPNSLRTGETNPPHQGLSATKDHEGDLDRTGDRKVGRKQGNEDRRRHDAGVPAGVTKMAPKSFNVKIDIVEGGIQHGKFDSKDSGFERKFLLFSPQYDDDGIPLPLKVRIQCDTALAEGVDLSEILWVVTKIPAEAEKEPLKVIAHGSFKTGFTQIAEIPSAWANKGTQIQVGADLGLIKGP